MTAHVVFPSVEPDGIPATISKRVLTEILREELGFDGVITTDCMEMNAISETIGVGEGAVQALLAGADMVMISHRLDRQEEAIHVIAEAVKAGRLPLERLQEAAFRIQTLRQKRLRHFGVDQPNFDELRKAAKELQEKAASRAVTLVRGSATLLERYSKAQRVAVLMDSSAPNMVAAGSQKQNVLPEVVQAEFPANRVDVYPFSETCDVNLASVLEDADLIVAGVHGTQNAAYIKLINELAANKKPLVVMALQSPYDISAVPNAETVIAIYENTPWMVRAAVRALLDGHFTGVLPVTVCDDLRAGTGVQFHRV
jgi:beta-N-acetylhexosaminidase